MNARPDLEVPGPSWEEATTAGIITTLPPATQERIRKSGKKFSEDQPRDDHGRFAELSGSGIDETAAYGTEKIVPKTPLTDEEKAVVGSYVGSGFETINAGLRGLASLSQYDKRDVEIIDRAIAKSELPENVILYRGVGNDEYFARPAFLDTMKVGDVIRDPAYASTTLNLDIGQAFAGNGWLMKIEAQAGTTGLFITDEMAASTGETEVLLPRNTAMTVSNLDETNKVVTVQVGTSTEKSAKYSDDQERDDHGRWTSGGDAGLPAEPPGPIVGGQYYGNLSTGAQQKVNDTLLEYGVRREDLVNEIRDRMTPELIAKGETWYQEGRDLAFGMSRIAVGTITPEQAAGALAAISPQCSWENNAETGARMADWFAQGNAEGLSPEDAMKAFRDTWKEEGWGGVGSTTGENRSNTALPENITKAFEIFMGATPEEALDTNKIRSFYNNIMFPGETSDVTVDVHMSKAFGYGSGLDAKTTSDLMSESSAQRERDYANGRHVDDTQVASVGFTALASAVREVADDLKVSPAVIQAAYWIDVQDQQPEGWNKPRASWTIDTPFSDQLETLGGQ